MVSKGFVLLLLTLFSLSCAFYIPGISPKNYIRGSEVDLKYNKIYSDKTQLPFEYISLPVCKPKTNKHVIENLGEILRGDRIIISNFEINMLVDAECKVLCDPIRVDKKSSERLSRLIKDDYKVEWIIDGLPSSTVLRETDSSRKQYEQGFNLGFYDKQTDKSYLFNHFNIRILYNKQPEEFDGVRIVGFEVFPVSVSSQGRTGCSGTVPKDAAPQMVGDETTLLYTYSVSFLEEPNLAWSSRWDLFLSNSNPHIHWYSIINSLIILLFLSAMVAIIMLRTLNNDISTYNSDLKEEQEDVTGWKLVHGDVFRPPKQGNLLASVLGSGIQFIGMVSSTVILSLFGILNPSYRGGMLSFAIFLFAFMGIFGGYYSARMYKVFKGSSWQKNALLTGTLFPGFLFAIFFVLNLFIWSQGSSSAIPFGTFVALVTLWFCISLPLVFLGAYFGQKKQVIEHPVRNNQIPRAIPDTSLFLHPVVSVLIGGLLPFAVVFIELFFIMKSVWQDQFYYMFGFLAIVTIMLVLSCVEITIVIIYFQLCSEDYHWWWRSFLISASSTIYIFIYGTYYYIRRLEIVAFVPGLIYFTYMIMACIVYFLCTGTIGFFACYYALRKIYSAVKIE